MIFKKILLATLIMSCLLSSFAFSAATSLNDQKKSAGQDEKAKPTDADFESFQNAFYKYIQDPTIKKETKVTNVIKGLKVVQDKGSFAQFRKFVAAADDILFTRYGDQGIAQDQILFIFPLWSQRERWVFKRPPEEVQRFMSELVAQAGDPKMMISVYWANAKDYAEKGKFDLADQELRKARNINLKGVFPDSERVFAMITDMMQFRYYLERGDLNAVLKMYPKMDAESNWFLNIFLPKNPQYLSIASDMVVLPRADLILGNFQHAINICNQIIKVTGGDQVRDKKILQSREAVYEILAQANKKLGNEPAASAYDMKSSWSGYKKGMTAGQLWKLFYSLMAQKHYEEARNLIPSMRIADANTAYRDDDLELYASFYDELPKFIDESKASNNGKDVWVRHYKKIILVEEASLNSIKNSGDKKLLLDSYSRLFQFNVFVGDPAMASLYARLYTNLFQDLRSSIGKNSQQLEIFTQAYSDQLKEFVDTYLELGDVESARLTLKIIKQNEYVDFLRQRSPQEVLISKLFIPPGQDAILRKIDLRAAEIEALRSQLKLLNIDASKNKEAIASISKSLRLKSSEVRQLRTDLQESVHAAQNKQNPSNRLAINLNRPDEALLDFYIKDSSVSLIVTTKKGSESFSNKVDRAELRKDILELYSSLSSPKKVATNPALSAKIANSLMLPKLASLKDQKIKYLKIRTDDLMAIAPLAILPIGQSDLSSLFTVEIQGLSDQKTSAPSNKELKAFGVTKAFNNFPALPSVKEEVQYISGLANSGSKTPAKISFVDGEFTKSSLLDAFNGGASTIHIASHYSPTKSSGSSGRLLLGDGSTISIEELNSKLQPKIGASLVTLSACDTGLVASGAGMSNLEGISNVFNSKGVNFVLGTLWEVSDESTADFMRLYYLLTVKGGVNPAEALNLAQKVFRAGNLSPIPKGIELPNDSFISGLKQRLPNYAHPFFWAPFQILVI